MDPTKVPNPNFDLPMVQLPEVEEAAPMQQQMTERLNMEAPHTAAAAPPPVAPTNPATAAAPINLMPVMPGSQPAAPVSMPLTGTMPASDSDLIEKAWVKTAKAIIEQTREDPYKQNKEITQMKVEYVKKRYNKDIKVNDSSKGS